MHIISRMLTDLDVVTEGKRPATYGEVDAYFDHALRAHGLDPLDYARGESPADSDTDFSQPDRTAETDPAVRDGTDPPQAGQEDPDWPMGGTAPQSGGDGTLPAETPDTGPVGTSDTTTSTFDDGEHRIARPNDPLESLSGIQASIAGRARPKSGSPAKSTAARKTPAKPIPTGAQTIRDGMKFQDWGGDIDATQRVLERYPALIKKFAGSAIQIAVVPDNVTQYPMRNPNGQPRNWPKGKTYKDVPAIFYDEGIVIVASKKIVGRSTDYEILHELGHALDFISTSIGGYKSSAQDEFKTAYASDLPKLRKVVDAYYYDDNASAGWSETYADSFAWMKTDRVLLKRQLPHIYAYWSKRGW